MNRDTLRLISSAGLITAVMLVVAVADLSYGYYQLLRVIVTAAAIALAYGFYVARVQWPILALAFLALLFNPVAPVHLDKETWVLIDLTSGMVVGAGAVFLYFKKQVTTNSG